MRQTEYKVFEAGELFDFLVEKMPSASRKTIKNMLTHSQVTVDDKTVTQYNTKLTEGQVVAITKQKVNKHKANLKGVEILFEDDAIIVINKAAGVLSMAGKNPSELTAYRQLTDYVKEIHPRQRLFIVHRLDRDTSGVMVFAKTEAAKEALQKNWHSDVKERKYTAMVEGVVNERPGTVSSWLTEGKTLKVYSSPFDNGGKHAITHYKKLQGNRHFSLLEVQLETGRKNQIRVHMQELGHSVVGDKKYGARQNPLKRLGLHATTLVFKHPISQEVLRFNAPVPAAFLKQTR
ncbi:RluA family pseudouridine synthase [Fundicoccus sp. Sow4_D5]|uniref:RluA family pseudouridine synthase n=1 Tax=unclassified Fundicoccus TaxID=2761543 RepID=UPI003F904232